MICRICHRPIVHGAEPRYAMADDIDTDTGEHYDCAFPNGRGPDTIEDCLRSLEGQKEKLLRALANLERFGR